jgi:hypothetical protein
MELYVETVDGLLKPKIIGFNVYWKYGNMHVSSRIIDIYLFPKFEILVYELGGTVMLIIERLKT